MKKNISINISGIIFHIEEDGYDKLKGYLGSIHHYFSTYEESEEIIADIENRIAEIFLAKLGQNKQVITVDDVQELIATMGTVDDFEAIENESRHQNKKQPQTDYHTNFNFEHETFESVKAEEYSSNRNKKRLYRDTKRKLIAGVAAGIAHYFSIDPLWIRLAFAATFLGVFGAEIIPTIALISYIAFWIISPVSDSLPEDTRIKKLFRNPERHILGGVASGLSSYFGADETVIRLLFVLGIPLGGAGLIIYLILWAITPEAKTLTDRMQMEGEPVTLSNIEKKIKESLDIDENDEENIFAKILVFPFRLIAKFFNFLSENFRPLGNFFLETIRIFSGGFLTMASFVIVLALLIALAAVLGLFSVPYMSNAQIDGVPLSLIRQSVPMWGLVALLMILIIPFFTFGLAGISVIAKRRVVSPMAAWSLFGFWILGLIGASATIPSFVQSFQVESSQKNIVIYKNNASVLLLDLNEQQEEGLGFVKLTIRGYDGKEIKLVQKVEARGGSQEEANENAQMIDYRVVQKDSTLIFDKNLLLKEGAAFRVQNVNMELFIPYGKEFMMKKELGGILNHTLHPFGYSVRDLKEKNKWLFDENGLKCLTCPTKPIKAERVDAEDELTDEDDDFKKEMSYFKNFSKVLIGSRLEVEIEEGEEYAVQLTGDKKAVENVKITQEKEEISINFDDKGFNQKSHAVKVYIKMPSLTDLNLQSRSNTRIDGFDEKSMNITLTDRAKCEAEIDSKLLHVLMKDRSELSLLGKGGEFFAVLEGRCEIQAFDFEADKVSITASDRSNAHVFAHKSIAINSKDRSEVVYKGKPKVVSGVGEFRNE
jgi:phage shock protein PspC (stress-responsive transcriptional regulator)